MADRLGQLRAELEARPGSSEAWGRFGQGLEAAEFHDLARVCYARAAGLDPASPRWPHLLGLLQLQDDPEAGLAHLLLSLSRPGATNEATRIRLAQALVERGRFDEAMPHLQVLLTARPDHAAARLETARIQLARQQMAQAAETLVPCLNHPYTGKAALILLSQIRARDGRLDEAAALAQRGAALPKPFDWPDPFQREVQVLRSDQSRKAEQIQTLIGQRRFADADAALAEQLQATPDHAEFLLLAGRSLLQQRRCPEAEERFRHHLKVSPESLNGFIQLALSLLCQQRWSQAEEVLKQAIALKPDFAQAHANLGLARTRLGRQQDAIQSFRDALRCSPGDANLHTSLAEALARAGNLAEAREQAERALRLAPSNARAKAILDTPGRATSPTP